MKDILISDVVCATNGKVDSSCANTDDYISNITTNSKDVQRGSLFIAIKGGHNFVQEAIDKGAVCCLLQDEVDVKSEGVTLIYVEDSVQAMIEFATFYRSQFNIPAIAITGSNGKTSTKDLVASVLSQKYNVLKTEGNFNNEIGVPLTIFNLREHHEMLVVEMGMNHKGEISRLVDIVKPNVAIITNIGTAHMEYLGSKEGILEAKLEITEALENNGLLILNDEDEMLHKVKPSDFPNANIVTYSKSLDSDYIIDNIVSRGLEGTTFDVTESGAGQTLGYTINYGGEFMVSNALCAIICGEHFEVSYNDIKKGVEEFQLSKNRLERHILKCGSILINDAYNASPESMRASLSILDSETERRKILVLGDMFELGENSARLHKELGEHLSTKDFDEIIFCGEMMRGAFQRYTKECDGSAEYVSSISEITDVLKTFKLKENDIVFFKASNGMKFKNVVAEVLENF